MAVARAHRAAGRRTESREGIPRNKTMVPLFFGKKDLSKSEDRDFFLHFD